MGAKGRVVRLGGRAVGAGRPAFLVAEAGINHNGSLRTALRMVDAAARARVDAVKFQVFTAEELVDPEAVIPPPAGDPSARPRLLADLLRGLSLDDGEVRRVKRRCDERGVAFLATPFDLPHVRLLDELDVVAFKVGSGDVTNVPMLEAMARTRRPVILSTGMSTVKEIDEAVRVLRAGRAPVVLLHCRSSYPAPFEGLRLRAMGTLARRYGAPVGFSDHTLGIEASIAAVALGACVIEKHFTLDRRQQGPDHAMSIEPDELDRLVRSVRNVEAALVGASVGYGPDERGIRSAARRGIVARVGIRRGQAITADMLAVRRPCAGLHPRYWGTVVGSTAARDIAANAPISRRDIRT